MNKKTRKLSFTLLELLVVIIIVAILAAIAIPLYRQHVDNVEADICTANQEALLQSLILYGLKYDEMPVQLAKAWQECGEEALAVVWERRKKEKDYFYLAYMSSLKVKYIIANIFSLSTLHAQPLFNQFIKDTGILRCPADPTPWNTRWDGVADHPVPVSYGLNRLLASGSRDADDRLSFRVASTTPVTFVLGDSDTSQIGTVSNIICRHRIDGEQVGIYIKPDRGVYSIDEDGREIVIVEPTRTGTTIGDR